ncbi:hypothetical protein P3633_22850 [Vibrio parahaemolyticus]|uniref:hypothetical protein n=1 Tax=Vibrio parahaemolyticus TaxID=670 RepID=UPI001869DDEE|nr:hypothetical protein [Vibrio parahaemolyticus]MDF5311723.1 hypothetical protein [Vibrio parahaemolyticus]MDF5316664.1 hypothetical protein [Vibrio parahaemolyticus]MDF5341043.1 hypothetical protein [Vibrio parahaemolyticus]MDF5351034.1 hypothetical protein [Vibrio parahaemolyticus]
MAEDEKWATNLAFVGNEQTVKKIIRKLNELEDSGEIEDLTGIEGPFESLQPMLKRRVENLALGADVQTDPIPTELTKLSSDIPVDDEIDDEDWFDEDNDFEDDDWFEDDDE